MIVRGHCGDWSVHSCVVDEWTRRSSEWPHLLIVVWYCVPLQRLSRVTASVINVTMRCWEMPQPIGGSDGGAWGQSWRFNPGVSQVAVQHSAQTSRRLSLLKQTGQQFQSVTYHPPTPQSFTHGVFWNVVVEGVEAGIWRLLSQFSPQWVGEGMG